MTLCICAYAQQEGQEATVADDVVSVDSSDADSLQRAFDCGCGGKKK
jgi:hypothetical protein